MTGVIAGAFGAHALKATLTPARLATWETAVDYQVWHALALLLACLLIGRVTGKLASAVFVLFVVGIVIFSGSLYLLCLTDTAWLGAITPIGGASFIAGWACLGLVLKRANEHA
ncbi:MAG: uncharacterized membrane protein YgdD (TMEM256/DUF423 family) [Myxococcota bacterium]|jgi:uncharacterized membrane protein YgdD (TMEM256/DUF423 family)